MNNFAESMLCFWIAYIIITIIGILPTVFNIYILKMGTMDENSMGEGYEKTKPWHPLYNIILFSFFGWLYMRGLSIPTMAHALTTAVIWVTITIVFDLFAWVIIKHPWSLSYREFYVDYQPWISFIYIAIFLGPIIGYILI